jgi:hypothetical protein
MDPSGSAPTRPRPALSMDVGQLALKLYYLLSEIHHITFQRCLATFEFSLAIFEFSLATFEFSLAIFEFSLAMGAHSRKSNYLVHEMRHLTVPCCPDLKTATY